MARGGGTSGLRTNVAIQQLRGVAILLVLMYHVSLSATIIEALGGGITNPGHAGVELFFVISGYVVASTMQAHGWSLRYFLSRRVFRLYPALIVFLAVSLGIVLLGNSYPEGAFARSFFGRPMELFWRHTGLILTGTYFQADSPLYTNGAMWSLSVEFQFYVAFAAFLLACGLAGLAVRRTGQILLAVTAAALAGVLVLRLAGLAGVSPPGPLGFLLAFKFDLFLPGVVLALALPGALARWRGPLPARPGWAMFGLMAVALVVLALNRSPLSARPPVDLLEGFAVPLVTLLFAGVVTMAVLLPDGFGQRLPWLRATLRWMGDRSYAIYLLHYPCLALTWFVFDTYAPSRIFLPWNFGIAQAVVGGGLTLLASEVTFRWVERPAIALGDRLLGRRPAAPAAALAPVTPA